MNRKLVALTLSATILSCEDFNDLTAQGSVVVTEKHGTYLKVTGHQPL